MTIHEFLNGWGVFATHSVFYAQHVNSEDREYFDNVLDALAYAKAQ